MKKQFYTYILVFIFIIGCISKKSIREGSNEPFISKNHSTKISKNGAKTPNDTIRIANDELQYEVIIIDPGFSNWLASRSFPRGYHQQSFLENKNIFYIMEWNSRVLQPQRYSSNLYEMTIDYDRNINYGYEVNYLIYNYMIYFQNTYKQNLYGFVPPR